VLKHSAEFSPEKIKAIVTVLVAATQRDETDAPDGAAPE
jgi:hypothetical protein